MTGNTSATATLVVSGCREFADIITPLYGDYSYNSLVNISDLMFPNDIITYNYDLPNATAINTYGRPVIDTKLMNRAVNGLKGKAYRYLTMTGSNVQFSEVERVLLGIYRITCAYGNEKFIVYVSGDGKHLYHRTMLVDVERQNYLAQKQQEYDNVPLPKLTQNKAALYGAGLFVIFAVFGIAFTGGGFKSLGSFFWGCLICFGVPILLYKKQQREYDDARNAIQQQIQAFNGEAQRARDKFANSGAALNGIYALPQK